MFSFDPQVLSVMYFQILLPLCFGWGWLSRCNTKVKSTGGGWRESACPDFQLVLLPPSCVTVGKEIHISEPQFPHLLEYGDPRGPLPFRLAVTSDGE